MLNLKQTAAAVLAFGSSAVFSGTMGTVCTPGNVTVPCAASAWGVGGQALYLESAFSGNQSYDPVFGNSNLIYGDTRNNWNWGFEIEASYYFNTGNDFTVNWYHLDANRSRHPFTLDGAGYTIDVVGRYKNQWDAINFELGQFVNFSDTNKIRFYGGLQLAQIKTNAALGIDTTALLEDDISASVVQGLKLKSKYEGVGPRTGVDMYYYVFDNRLGFYAKAATALLVGTGKSNYGQNASFSVNGIPSETGAVYLNDSRTSLVPEVEAKLGANYTYVTPYGHLTLDVGYMWFNYFNALSNFEIVTCKNKLSDYGAAGPYVGLKYVS